MPNAGWSSGFLGGPGLSWAAQGQPTLVDTLTVYFTTCSRVPHFFLSTPRCACCCTPYCLLTHLWVQAAAERSGPPTAWSILDSKRVNGVLTVQESFQHPASSSELSCSLTFEADGSIRVQVSSLVLDGRHCL